MSEEISSALKVLIGKLGAFLDERIRETLFFRRDANGLATLLGPLPAKLLVTKDIDLGVYYVPCELLENEFSRTQLASLVDAGIVCPAEYMHLGVNALTRSFPRNCFRIITHAVK